MNIFQFSRCSRERALDGVLLIQKEADFIEVDLYEGLNRSTRRLLKVYIKLGWKKLDKYYNKLSLWSLQY